MNERTGADRSLTPEEQKALADFGEGWAKELRDSAARLKELGAPADGVTNCALIVEAGASALRSASREPASNEPDKCLGCGNPRPRNTLLCDDCVRRHLPLPSGEPAPREPSDPGSLTIREVP